MTVVADKGAYKERLGQLEAMLGGDEDGGDPAARAKTEEIVRALLEYHGAGLAKMMECLGEAGEAGRAITETLAGDELVASLLLLHGLHPLDLETRVRGALEKVQPYLSSHGGHVELVGISPEGAIRLRLEGSCHGCPSSRVTLKSTIEEAIYEAAPDVVAIDVEGAVDDPPPAAPVMPGFVPVSQLVAGLDRPGRRNGKHQPIPVTAPIAVTAQEEVAP